MSDLISIAAPAIQSLGTNQGVFFDPTQIGSPGQLAGPSPNSPALVNNPAFLNALGLYRLYISTGPSIHTPNDACTGALATDLFGQGRCLMTFGYNIFKASCNLRYNMLKVSCNFVKASPVLRCQHDSF